MSAENGREAVEVTVIGAGLAGMAASIHLANAGLRVLCIDAETAHSDPVGESLDWSAPALLDALGLPMEYLVEQGVATYKRHVKLKLGDGEGYDYVPGEWLGKSPFHVNLRTMHVDRTQLNQRIRSTVLTKGVTLVRDKVVRVETAGRRVEAIVTARGDRISSRWYLDASGSGASLFPRLFHSPAYEYGPRKVAIWNYFPVTQFVDGTTLHVDASGTPYMEWVWQIPIHPAIVSVGYVCTAESVKQKRQQGMSVQSIFQSQLDHFPGLRNLSCGDTLRTTSFRCQAFVNIVGPNWLVIGEAAAMVDPMTANGVTAALRHAAEASSLIARFRNREALPWLPAALYQQRTLSLAKFFNCGIEKVLYDWPIRNRVGAYRAGDVYTIPAWSTNLIYSRLRPRGWISTAAFCALLRTLTMGWNILHWFCMRSRSKEAVSPIPLSS
jgi:flavin-dependent dehydrogenase